MFRPNLLSIDDGNFKLTLLLILNINSMRKLIRIFSSDKLIDIPMLNALGLQIFRIFIARVISNARAKLNLDCPQVDQLKREGYAIIENFLAEDDFRKLYTEYRKLMDSGLWRNGKSRKDGPNQIFFLSLGDLDDKEFPNFSNFLKNETVNNIFQAVEKKGLDLRSKLVISQFQYLIQGEDDGSVDPETDLHADTFFNTHKAWFYLEDVKLENGPFVYVPGTHNFSLKGRLHREYTYSLNSNQKGSRRVHPDELRQLDLEEKVIHVQKNTLVVANTLGYHRRLRGEPGYDRPTIAISVRPNPFKP